MAEETENEEERGGSDFGGVAAEVVGGSRGTFGVRGTGGEGCSSSLLVRVRERRKWRFPLRMMSDSLLENGEKVSGDDAILSMQSATLHSIFMMQCSN